MKKILIILPAILLCGIRMYGQNVKFNDLVFYTNLSNEEVHSYLRDANKFKQDFSKEVNGQPWEWFKSITVKKNDVYARPDTERITIGGYLKLYDGNVLKSISYTSTNPQDILGMIGQAQRYGLNKRFQGADNSNNIYLFDNDYYQVNIYLRRDHSSGLVEIKQKEFLGQE